MNSSSLLPKELSSWLRSLSKEELQQRMRRSITRRAVAAGLSIEAATLSAATEALDERYFAQREVGREAESMELFRQARMLAALRYLHDGENEEALYEFTHSIGDATAAAVIAELERS